VQLVYFLHLGASREQRGNTVIFILTVMLITTIVGLSLWVMHNANDNMMPMQMTPEHAMSRD
jgi:cytochrome o ubiquinol oxidase subunit IV